LGARFCHGALQWLVVANPLENMKVSGDDSSQYMENNKCSKPPTSFIIFYIWLIWLIWLMKKPQVSVGTTIKQRIGS